MKNYVSLKRLVAELNRSLGILSDVERDNILHYYYNQGLISYRQFYLLHISILKHEYIHDYFIQMYSDNW